MLLSGDKEGAAGTRNVTSWGQKGGQLEPPLLLSGKKGGQLEPALSLSGDKEGFSWNQHWRFLGTKKGFSWYQQCRFLGTKRGSAGTSIVAFWGLKGVVGMLVGWSLQGARR